MTNYDSRANDVMIAGAQKAGTSSLGDYLDQHPQIATHSQLEMAYFVRDEDYSLGYDQAFSKYFHPESQSDIVLAKSVGIMYFPTAMQRLYEHNPNCKIITVLREPVSRAYSAYWYMRRVGFETASTFSEALALEDDRKTQDFMKWSPCLYRDRGIYHTQIKNLQHVFGVENVHILLLDDLIADPAEAMKSILDFIGIDHMSINTSAKSNTAKVVRFESLSRFLKKSGGIKRLLKSVVPLEYLTATRKYVQTLNEQSIDIPPIAPHCQDELANFFAPHNQALEDTLSRPLTAWKIRSSPREKCNVTGI